MEELNLTLTSDQLKLRDSILRFTSESLCQPDSRPAGKKSFDSAAWRRCADFGVMGWAVPTAYGGAGLDPLDLALAFETLGLGCRDNGLVFAINNHVWACLAYVLHHGTEEQKRRWLPRLCDGSVIGAQAMTEPESGSDVLSISTRAVRTETGWRLDGTKTFISNGACADLFVVFARTGAEDAPQRALSAFLVTADQPGFSSTPLDKMGLAGCPMGELRFDGCQLGPDALLGAEGAGYQIFTSGMERERGLMFASQVGVLQRILDDCVQHASTRRQFGAPIGTNQAVSHRIADMRVRVELARLLLYKVGALKREGRMALLEAAMLKLFVSESLVASATDAVRLHGARGYVSSYGVEHELRDALATTIYGGTSDIQRNIIAALSGVPAGQPS